MSEQSTHSRLSFSSRYRWKKDACPGSVRMCEGLHSPDSAASIEGTKAHEVAEHYVRAAFGLPSLNREGVMSEDPDMHKHGQMFAELLAGMTEGHVVKCATESRVNSKHLHEMLYGTADVVMYIPATRHLIVADYKYGKRFVNLGTEFDPNPQLDAYGVSAEHMINDQIDIVTLVVFQPRLQGGQPWKQLTLNADLVRGDFSDKLKADAEATDAPDAPVVPGSWCDYCPAANGSCQAAKGARDKLARLALGLLDVSELADADLVDIYRANKLLKVQIDATDTELRKRVQANPTFGHGLTYKPRKGSLGWKGDVSEIVTDLINLDFRNLLRPVTVSDAKIALPTDVLAVLTERGPDTAMLTDAGGDSAIGLNAMLLSANNPFAKAG